MFFSKQHSGSVHSIKDTIANVSGLQEVTSGEMVEDAFGTVGLVLNLETDKTGIVMFNDNIIKAGDTLFRLFSTLSILIDPLLLSNVVDSIGSVLNQTNILNTIETPKIIKETGVIRRNVELKAPGIIVRQPVYEPLVTGILGIDSILPLGQGQRELIIGDKQTGKTAIAIDVFLNQSNIDVLDRRAYINI